MVYPRMHASLLETDHACWCMLRCAQKPDSLAHTLAPFMHLVDALARVSLVTMRDRRDDEWSDSAGGRIESTYLGAAIVPFKKNTAKMTLLKGEAALAARRHVASKITNTTISALLRPLNPEQPDFALIQQLWDAGISKCPCSGYPIIDPSACTLQLRTTLWRAYCGVATTINKRALGNTDEALQELQEQLHNHVARPAKRPRAVGDDEATDFDNEDSGEQLGVKRRRRNSVNTEGEDSCA